MPESTPAEIGAEGRVVPGELAVAMTSGRIEFINPLVAQLREGRTLPQEQVTSLVLVTRDLLLLRDQDRKVIEELRGRITALYQACKGAVRMTKELDDLSNKLFADLASEDSEIG
jgi:hypothetical protein